MRRSPLGNLLLVAAVLALASCGSGGGGGASGTEDLVQVLTTSVPPAATGQEDYSFFFEASFPHPPGTFILSGGNLPTGMKLDPATGELTGVPRQVGAFSFAIAAQDGNDSDLPPGRDVTFAQDLKTFSMQIAKGPPNLLTQTLPTAQYRAPYGYALQAAGGTKPYFFEDVSVPPDGLPSGLIVTPDGFIGPFPAPKGVQGSQQFHFEVRLTDADGNSDVQELDVVVVVKPLVIETTSPLPPAAAEFPYSTTLELASEGGGPPIVWSQVPPGPGETALADINMALSPAGVLANVIGTPGPRSDISGPFVPPYTVTFTVQVTDEPLQIETRTYSLTVKPGPVLTSISPNRASTPGPFTVKGLNFQPGATLTFKPGPTEVVVTTTFVNEQTLTFPTAPEPPAGGTGAVPVMVTNPDGGFFTLPAAFVFPAANLSFSTKGFIASALSSTGLDCADVNGDGRADVVHCGAAGVAPCSGTATSTSPGLVYLANSGGSPLSFAAQSLDSASYYDVKFADVNVDGRLDIVALSQSVIRVWLNGVSGNALGTFTAGPTSALPSLGSSYPSEMAIGRLDSDAVPDVAFGVANYPVQQQNGSVYSMRGNGSGGFTLADSATATITNTWGVTSLICVDADGDGRDEVAAGQGLNQAGTGPLANYSATGTNGTFGTWATRGGSISSPLYASTTGMIAGDFLGNGGESVVAIMTGSPNYSPGNLRYLAILSGSDLTTQTKLTAPTAISKCGTPLDGDFDAKMDFAITTHEGGILVYRGSSQALAVTLDASAGSPAVSAPRTGRLASGDLDGDGRPDVLATTSYWACSAMATYYSTIYNTGTSGNGGSMGIVYYLNDSN